MPLGSIPQLLLALIMTSANELQQILDAAIASDEHEEDAQDFLDDHAIPYFTHNRQSLITLAYRNGWRPHQ
jgi:hypothetical protein